MSSPFSSAVIITITSPKFYVSTYYYANYEKTLDIRSRSQNWSCFDLAPSPEIKLRFPIKFLKLALVNNFFGYFLETISGRVRGRSYERTGEGKLKDHKVKVENWLQLYQNSEVGFSSSSNNLFRLQQIISSGLRLRLQQITFLSSEKWLVPGACESNSLKQANTLYWS